MRRPALELGRRGAAAGHLGTAAQIFMLFADELPRPPRRHRVDGHILEM